MLIVMTNGDTDGTWGGGSNPAAMEVLGQELIGDVIPLVEKHYRVLANRENRAVTGLSMGGGQAFTVGLKHLDTFAWVGQFSSGLVSDADFDLDKHLPGFLRDPASVNRRLKLLFLELRRRGPTHARADALVATLKQHDIRHVWFGHAAGPTNGRSGAIRWPSSCRRSSGSDRPLPVHKAFIERSQPSPVLRAALATMSLWSAFGTLTVKFVGSAIAAEHPGRKDCSERRIWRPRDRVVAGLIWGRDAYLMRVCFVFITCGLQRHRFKSATIACRQCPSGAFNRPISAYLSGVVEGMRLRKSSW